MPPKESYFAQKEVTWVPTFNNRILINTIKPNHNNSKKSVLSIHKASHDEGPTHFPALNYPLLSVWKIIEKVSFNTASEASYIYILSGQKFIKKAKKWSILASFWKPEACGQTVLPDWSVLIGQNLVENAKIQMRHFE